MEIQQGNKLDLGVAGSRKFDNLQFILLIGNEKKVFDKQNISPDKPWKDNSIQIEAGQENSVSLIVLDEQGKELIAYHHREISKERNRKLAFEPKQPQEVT